MVFRNWSREKLYNLRVQQKISDAHKYLGFSYGDFSQAELESPAYREVFSHVHDKFWSPLRVAAISDAADVVLKRYASKRMNTWIDYSFLFSFAIQDAAFCDENPDNFFDWNSAFTRFGQGMVGGALKNPDSALDGLKELAPFSKRIGSKYIPWKTALVAGIIFERADEMYENQRRMRDIA